MIGKIFKDATGAQVSFTAENEQEEALVREVKDRVGTLANLLVLEPAEVGTGPSAILIEFGKGEIEKP